jgi:hypothetical protein
MLRTFVCAMAMLLLCVGGVRAEELKGKIKKVGNHVLTVTVDGKEHELQIGKETKLLGPNGDPLKDGLKNPHLKEGTDVVAQVEKKDGKEVASEVKLTAPKKDK